MAAQSSCKGRVYTDGDSKESMRCPSGTGRKWELVVGYAGGDFGTRAPEPPLNII